MLTLILMLAFLINKNLLSNIKERIEVEEELSKVALKITSGKMNDLINAHSLKWPCKIYE